MPRVSGQREPSPADSLTTQVREYNYVKTEADRLSKRQKELRDALMEVLEKTGYEDGDGHLWIDFEEDIDGITAIQRQRRTSRSTDESAAAQILIDRGLEEVCYQTVKVLDEEAIYRALYEGDLTEEDIDKIFPQKVTYALVTK